MEGYGPLEEDWDLSTLRRLQGVCRARHKQMMERLPRMVDKARAMGIGMLLGVVNCKIPGDCRVQWS